MFSPSQEFNEKGIYHIIIWIFCDVHVILNKMTSRHKICTQYVPGSGREHKWRNGTDNLPPVSKSAPIKHLQVRDILYLDSQNRIYFIQTLIQSLWCSHLPFVFEPVLCSRVLDFFSGPSASSNTVPPSVCPDIAPTGVAWPSGHVCLDSSVWTRLFAGCTSTWVASIPRGTTLASPHSFPLSWPIALPFVDIWTLQWNEMNILSSLTPFSCIYYPGDDLKLIKAAWLDLLSEILFRL